MAKTKTIFICNECGKEHFKWAGRCSDCGEWNTLEEVVESSNSGSFGFGRQARSGGTLLAGTNLPQKINEIQADAYQRIKLPLAEFSRVLGGGVVPGSLVLVGGDPGIGKSTLLQQVAGLLAESLGPVLYLSGEESVYQIKMRAERLGVAHNDLYLLSETNLDIAIEHVRTLQPKALIIDSIQTVYLQDLSSSAGSVSQVRECAARLMQLAKSENLPIFLVGHVTKEGHIAGPRVLEHIVDTVLYLEGDRFHTYRLLRAQKNRFGSTNEVGVFEMKAEGMVEVSNPSEAFLAEHQAGATGSAVAVTLEGTRPLLLEMQGLVSQSAFSQPRRTANGIDLSRLHLLLAVLSKRVGLALHNQDVFVNVVGGIHINEPAADLAVAAAIASSFREKAIQRSTALIGEIGLGGELRSVSQLDKRLNEAAKLGFTRCILPKHGKPSQPNGLELVPVGTVVEALHLAMRGG
ncbi:MAG: DNA repair protein RadA [Anaerolineales bacterium]|nr:DNA repair protein RadA [Anaerolineales bacterium]MCB9128666.1 DNA repair protein RadA [Ardenticatenales bacterium]